MRSTGLFAAVVGVVLSALSGCVDPPPQHREIRAPDRRQVTIITPRCADARSCFLGRITEAETGYGLADAVVFIQRIDAEDRIVKITDRQGVFELVDVAPGQYRVRVYKSSLRGEVAAMELGQPGTTVLTLALARD